jgi:hypothetical protein
MLIGQTGFGANATARRILDIWVNGVTAFARSETDPNQAQQCFTTVSGIYNATAGDYVELYAWQNTGSTLSTVSGALYSPQFAAYKIGG